MKFHCLLGLHALMSAAPVLQAGAAALLTLGSSGAALANEFDLLSAPTPTTNFILDDAGVLNKTTKKSINDELSKLEVRHVRSLVNAVLWLAILTETSRLHGPGLSLNGSAERR